MKEQKKSNKDWETIEKITAILEKYISPNSKVEHNVKLPTLVRKGYRQCDVVITVQEPRKHITIVEVQKRNKPIDINTFSGWITKMDSVGAQQLICVSKEKYPQSIIDEVQFRYGTNKVTLMTLKEFDILDNLQDSDYFFLSPTESFHCQFTNLATSKVLFIGIDDKGLPTKILPDFTSMKFSIDDRIFGDKEGKNLTSLNNIINDSIGYSQNINFSELISKGINSGPCKINILEEHQIYLHFQNQRFLIADWEISFFIIFQKDDKPTKWRTFGYRSEIVGGNLAWFAKGYFEYDNEEVEVNIVFQTTNGLSVNCEVVGNPNIKVGISIN